MDVRPHPHIGLATVTYLFEGEILHRDSLGTRQPIRPGDVNWMTAGRGIAHSERTDRALRAPGQPPVRHADLGRAAEGGEETEPASTTTPPPLYRWSRTAGCRLRLIAGTGCGELAGRAPRRCSTPTPPRSRRARYRCPSEHEERAV